MGGKYREGRPTDGLDFLTGKQSGGYCPLVYSVKMKIKFLSWLCQSGKFGLEFMRALACS